jgi:putative transposase
LIERKPPRTARRSDAALAVGAELHPLFRKHVPLDAPLTERSVQAIALATGLQERRIRELAKRYRQNPVAESLASLPKGPKPGSRHAAADVLAAIEGLIDEIYLKMAGPSVAESARQIRGLLIADNGNYRFEPGVVPSERSIARMIAEISAPQRARTRMGSKARSAHEPHPYEYVSKGFLDVVQMIIRLPMSSWWTVWNGVSSAALGLRC